MRVITCHLTLPDGLEVVGKISAESPQGHWPIVYEGAIDSIEPRPSAARPDFLRLYFRTKARELGGQLRAEETGEFDSWAE